MGSTFRQACDVTWALLGLPAHSSGSAPLRSHQLEPLYLCLLKRTFLANHNSFDEVSRRENELPTLDVAFESFPKNIGRRRGAFHDKSPLGNTPPNYRFNLH